MTTEQLYQLILGVGCPGLCILVFAPLGVLYIYLSFRGRREVGTAQNWLTTQGEITQSQVSQSGSYDPESGIAYVPEVKYIYQVGGKQYTGEKVTLDGYKSFSTVGGATKITRRYLVNQQVKVYYDPQDPSQAVLERRKTSNMTNLVLGIVLLLLAGCMLCAVAYTLASNFLPEQMLF
ncbi:MAG: DUF3592 domain-containing protein [Anaerolineales bacterium]|nr:DUF3592 domain-containing protein [Anaerolineales bacterium]